MEVLDALQVDPDQGLDETDAALRRRQAGSNLLPASAGRSALRRFASQFNSVLIYLLLVTAAVAYRLGDRLGATVILAVVLVNALVGFIQEGKAERAILALSSLLPSKAIVLREGRRVTIDAARLVPGDIVYLAAGDRVPADLRLLAAHGLRIDESALTGESMTADKSPAPAGAGAALADRHCLAYCGTLVRHGTGIAVVVATGSASEMGRISAMVANIEPLATPMLRKIAHLSRWITVTVLVVAGAVFAFGTLLRGYPAADMFSAGVSLAVAAVPEGLPAVITITLAMGVRRMARRRVVVRRLPAVEVLGAATVICTDKTGTLTRNEMVVRRVILASEHLEVAGEGYCPAGSFHGLESQVDPQAVDVLGQIGLACVLCNDAQLHDKAGQWDLSGDPTEGALLCLALKAGLDADSLRAAFPRIAEIPFDSDHGFMATMHVAAEGSRAIFLKGAPERVLPLCQAQRRLGRDESVASSYWEQSIGRAAGAGMRLIAVAVRTDYGDLERLDLAQVRAGGFTLLGILALVDPPRAEAIAAVARCLDAGIRVKMMTGDHAETARAIGKQIGFPRPVRAVTGDQLDAMDDDELVATLAVTDVYARVSPAHKLRLVVALQAGGDVVVMTGDGVNDAPALKQAHVGVAMGRKGTEAAREAAEIVLADDNFATLAAAVEEGRVVDDNVRKTIAFTLPTNGGEAGMLMLAILFGITLPITPVQILWVNLITEITLSFALAVEKAEADVMRRPPRDPAEPLVTGWVIWRIALVSVLMVAGCTGLYLLQMKQGGTLEQARTTVVNGLVAGHIGYLFATRRFRASALSWEGFSGSRAVLGASLVAIAGQLVLTHWTPAQFWFGTADLDAQAWAGVGGLAVLVLLAVELEKRFRRG